MRPAESSSCSSRRRRRCHFLPAHVHLRVLPAPHAGTWWEQTALRTAARQEPLDAFFAPAYTAPLGLCVPLALTIHDVSFLAHPEWFRPRERMRRRWLTRRSAAGGIGRVHRLGRSRATKSSPHPARLRPGRGDCRLASVRGIGRPRARRERDPLVLFVGSVFNRRRLPAAHRRVRARHGTPRPTARLAIVGANRTWPRQDLRCIAADHGVRERVDVRSYVDDGELAALYSRASIFAFLSEYEGFGLTPLWKRSPPACRSSCSTRRWRARSTARPRSTCRPPPASRTPPRILRSALDGNAGTQATLRHAGSVLQRYSWDDAAARTLAGIERMVRRT